MIYNLTGFSDVRIFSIVFRNDIIMTSFLVKWFSNLHILWNLPKAIILQSFSAVDCLGQVLQKDYENKMMTFFGTGFETSIFCGTDYKLSTCEISNPQLSESNFTEVFKRHPKKLL